MGVLVELDQLPSVIPPPENLPCTINHGGAVHGVLLVSLGASTLKQLQGFIRGLSSEL